MTKTTKTVTVTVGRDPSVLGDAATHEDLERYGRNLCNEIETRFGVSTLMVRGSRQLSVDCDEPEIHEWLSSVSQSDEWVQYL